MEHTLTRMREQILNAARDHIPLTIRGGGTKDFYGEAARPDNAEMLDTREHSGIVAYDPAELVITARAGTPLAEIEAALAESRQVLPFEPPHFGSGATIGGAVAAGLAGPRRAHAGAVKDFVLGARLLDGKGGYLHFGGTVVKNVAGYDVARLLAGSLGTLGVMTEVSLKVLPQPFAEATLQFESSAAEAVPKLNALMGQPFPLTAGFWADGILSLRLCGTEAGVQTAVGLLGGERMDEAVSRDWWRLVREQARPEFSLAEGERLWRISVPDTAPVAVAEGLAAMEWGGGLRWYRSGAAAQEMRALAQNAGGHATLFRGRAAAGETVFTPLPEAVLAINRRLKQHFDPSGIFNPGRMYPDF
ncbi:glycolate oxidase subunit GlcE [Uruburuella testudinis]|uniref:Glycolate oxidase subunit GlcE n=1 Tax=Uruburuella testudinis TaxID=1282863 RepID=A0ABY4DRE3_9NEIS|nr:glycolate oxidase subunit GlcE [Uruburuella testudinis]UOO81299.1 glycolate oxidase subunit GlcE [Uruburuella testudinis]